ncbi:MAG: putative DNA modification/repair radical SAM protein [Lachnospiraceae bacterium]
MDLIEKLQILSDAAKYDVACTSSGSERKGQVGAIGNSVAAGICHTFSADGRCISLLKILYTNHCIFDCKYCINRSSNDVVRTSFTPEEVCTLTIEFYRRNYIEGLFLSSGIKNTPNETMAEIVQTLMLLREKYHFNGYIHCKAIPGADPDLVELAGWYADRMSVNLELPTAEGLRALAPHKNRKNILLPMRQIQAGIEENMLELGVNDSRGRYWYTSKALGRLEDKPWLSELKKKKEGLLSIQPEKKNDASVLLPGQEKFQKKLPGLRMSSEVKHTKVGGNRFVPAGQSTQMIIGATPESDYQILSVAEALYRKFDLKRVFYSAFVRVNEDSNLPVLPGGPPLRREHRLYQADWLLRYYGFEAKELLSEKQPNFNEWIDPKCDWAIRNLERFPVEINRADYYTLLRVPGIGVRSAKRIVEARRSARLDFTDLKKIGVVLKRAIYFITCSGKMYYPMHVTEGMVLQNLLMLETLPNASDACSFQQLSLFDLEQLGGRLS